jgi:hypothetical protein
VGIVVNVFTLAAMIVAWIVIYYVISYAVLWLVGKAFPLTGRRRT